MAAGVTVCLMLLALVLKAAIADAAVAHAWGLVTTVCVSFLQFVGGVSALTLLTLPLLIASLAISQGVITYTRTRTHVRKLLRERVYMPQLPQAAERSAVNNTLDVVDNPELVVFAYGLIRPRVLISTAALDHLNHDELAAVLEHEAHHVARRDPLRVFVAEAASRAFFMVPLVGDLKRHFLISSELAADRRALSTTTRTALASALMKFLGSPRIGGLPNVAPESRTDVRIVHLLEPEAFRLPLNLHRSSLLRSAGFAVCLAALAAILAAAPSTM